MAGSVTVDSQYSAGQVRQSIESALRDAGKDPAHLEASELALMEDFHTSGRLATADLLTLAGISAEDVVLDAGAGIGGTSRAVAGQIGSSVTAIDLTQEFCEVAAWLNQAVGLAERIDVTQGDVLALPFEDHSFDVVLSQHVQMNIADKDALYREARRVLAPGGRLAIWDVTAGPAGDPEFPLPWADTPALSHLVTPERLAQAVGDAGFQIAAWNDLSESSVDVLRFILQAEQPALGLHVYVPEFTRKIGNLLAALEQRRARTIQALAIAA